MNALNEKESTIPLSDGELIAMYPNINELIAEGLAEAHSGKCSDGEEFLAELEREMSRETAPDRKTARICDMFSLQQPRMMSAKFFSTFAMMTPERKK
jgi:hypothetical protein